MTLVPDDWRVQSVVAPARRRIAYAAVTLVVGGLALAYGRAFPDVLFPVDDAYITLHNAQQLAAGGSDAFGVAGLVGATSALHVVLVWLGLLVWSPLHALCNIGWLGVLAYALGGLRLSFDFGCKVPTALALTLAMLTVAHTPNQLLNGLETGWALALVTWTLVLSHAERGIERRLFPVVLGLLPFLRPELLVLVPLFAVATIREAEVAPVARQRRLLLDGATVLATMLPWLLLYWWNTGLPYPTTVQAKRYFFAEACLPAVERWSLAAGAVRTMAIELGVIALAIVTLPRSWRGAALLAFMLIDFGLYFVQLPGALAHYGARYQYIAIPMLVYGLLRLRTPMGLTVRRVVVFVAVAQTLFFLPSRLADLNATLHFTEQESVPLAAFLERHVPAGDTILLHDVGYVGYALRGRHLVDIVGLKSPSNITYHRALTTTSCGAKRGEATHRIARSHHAQWVVVLDRWDDTYKFVDQLLAFGWKAELVRPDGAYRVYRLTETPPSLQGGHL